MRLYLQIVYEDGAVCKFAAGSPIEIEIVEAIAKDLSKRRFSLLFSLLWKKDYDAAIRQSIRATLLEFKKNGRTVVGAVR